MWMGKTFLSSNITSFLVQGQGMGRSAKDVNISSSKWHVSVDTLPQIR